ncbi:MAG: PKD domain-containing protein, partial [Bacteroidota bacterium]|nr:PKD domain-containing protein [Bacteroidota bacterium]MDX5427281.1 PKD domain-containing protein [Bacteroidota bacterium]
GTAYGWYANMTDTVALAVGDTFKVPTTGPNTYYVEYQNNADSLLTTFAAGNGQSGNMFDIVVKNGISLTGLSVNPQGSGSQTFEVYHRTGSFSGFENSSAGWTLIETHVGTAVTSGKYYFPLTTPLTLAPGTHALYVTATTGSVSYTNGSNPGGVYASNNDIDFLEGIGKSYPFGSTFNPRIWNGILHYGSVGCSNIRVPVTFEIDSAIVVASGTATSTGTGSLTANFDASATTGGDVFTWKFGDGNTGTGMTTSHTYGQGGDYTVWLIATDTTCGTVDSVQIALNGLNVNETLLDRSLSIFPNPTQGIFNVSFDIEGVQTVQVRLINLIGQEIAKFHYGHVSGTFKQSYDLSGQADGVYLIEIRSDQGITTRRINLHR